MRSCLKTQKARKIDIKYVKGNEKLVNRNIFAKEIEKQMNNLWGQNQPPNSTSELEEESNEKGGRQRENKTLINLSGASDCGEAHVVGLSPQESQAIGLILVQERTTSATQCKEKGIQDTERSQH